MPPLACRLSRHIWCEHYSTERGAYYSCSRCSALTYPGPRIES